MHQLCYGTKNCTNLRLLIVFMETKFFYCISLDQSRKSKKMRYILAATFMLIWVDTSAQEHLISLKKQRERLFPKTVNLLQVIDARNDRLNIGWVQKGIGNIKVTANFKKPFIDEISEFLTSNFINNPEGLSLIVKINRLSVTEHTGFGITEKAFTYLSLEFILKEVTGYYSLLETSQIIRGRGIDVTGKHDDNIALAFKRCFDELTEIDDTNIGELKKISKSQLLEPVDPKRLMLNLPIFKEEPVEGIYHNFTDFKYNTPENEEEFYIERLPRMSKAWAGSYRLIPRYKLTDKKVKGIWGFYNGDSIYVSHKMGFFPVTVNEEGIYFYGYGLVDGSGGAIPGAAAGFVGGLVGGAVFWGVAAGTAGAAAKAKKVKYFIDPFTGKVGSGIEIFSNTQKTGAKVKIILFRRGKAEKEDALKVTIDGDRVVAFFPNSFLELNYILPQAPIEICLNDQCGTLNFSEDETIYMECSYAKKGKSTQPKLVRVNEEVGKFYSKKAKYFQEIREKEGEQ